MGVASGFSADADQFFLEALAFCDVLGGVALHAGDGFGRQFANHLGRRTKNQRVSGEHLALGDDGTGTDQAVVADDRAD